MSDNDLNEMTKDEVLGELAEEADPIARRLAQLEGELERMRKSRARLLGRSVAACMVSCALLFGVSAVAQQQEQLVTFRAGTPARFDEVNRNFDLLRQWIERIERKIGEIDEPGRVSTGTVTANDTVSAGTVSAWTVNMTGADFRFAPLDGRGDGGRAFVHWVNDSLAINFENDFSGGTEVHGPLRVTGGLSVQGNSLENIIDSRIRDWVRGHCRITIGWRDGCDRDSWCHDYYGPGYSIDARADGSCGDGDGASNTYCSGEGGFSSIRYHGNVNGDDVVYARFVCD